MRWSVFTVGDNLENRERRPERFQEILGYTERAEALGFWAFFFAEHHFDPHGEIADPWLMTAAAAERTRGGRIRLGPMVSNLAFRNPIQVAEQALLVQEMSHGRVEIGVGSGNVLREHVAFGLGPDPMSRKRAAFDENLPRFLDLLAGRPISIPGDAHGGARVSIPPLAQVREHVWITVGRSEVMARFAREGHPVALGPPFATMDSLEILREQVETVRAACPPERFPRVAAAFPIYVGADTADALRALDRFLLGKHRDGFAHLPPSERPDSPGRSAADLVDRNLAIIATPREAPERVREIAECGITDFFAIPDFGGLRPDAVERSLEEIARLAEISGPRGSVD